MTKPESYGSVWDAIADTPGQAANLRARTELMRQIAAFVNKQGWTQVEAAPRGDPAADQRPAPRPGFALLA